MIIPKEKQKAFIMWFKSTAGPELGKFGALKHELYKVADSEIIGGQKIEKNQYIGKIYFNDNFDIPKYFSAVKNNPEAWKISRMYEEEFGATKIELRALYLVRP